MGKYDEYEKRLVPCRCGGKVILTGGTYGYPTFGIMCLKCGGQWSMDTYSPEEASEKWGLIDNPIIEPTCYECKNKGWCLSCVGTDMMPKCIWWGYFIRHVEGMKG